MLAQMDSLVAALGDANVALELERKPQLRGAVSRLLPVLTRGLPLAARRLARAFAGALDWAAMERCGPARDAEAEEKGEGALRETKSCDEDPSPARLPPEAQCVLDALAGLPRSHAANALRAAAAATDLVDAAVDAVLRGAPSEPVPTAAGLSLHRLSGAAAPPKAACRASWARFAARAPLPWALRALRGLCDGPGGCAERVAALPGGRGPRLVAVLHGLDQLPSARGGLGLLAEGALGALSRAEGLASVLEGLRAATAREKRRLARKRKRSALRECAATAKWAAAAEALPPEGGLACMICQEGHATRPEEPLGVYAFQRRCRADLYAAEGLALLEGDAAAALAGASVPLAGCLSHLCSAAVVSSVSAFNPIHRSCHQDASAAAAAAPRGAPEWDSASSRNNRIRCNALLPLPAAGAAPAALAAYAAQAEAHGASPTAVGGLCLALHDARLLLLRLAHREDVAEDCGGGSPATNLRLLPPLLSLAAAALDSACAPLAPGAAPRDRLLAQEAARCILLLRRFYAAAAPEAAAVTAALDDLDRRAGLDPGTPAAGAKRRRAARAAGPRDAAGALHDGAAFVGVLSLVLLPPAAWAQAREPLARQLLRHARAASEAGRPTGSGVRTKAERRPRPAAGPSARPKRRRAADREAGLRAEAAGLPYAQVRGMALAAVLLDALHRELHGEGEAGAPERVAPSSFRADAPDRAGQELEAALRTFEEAAAADCLDDALRCAGL